MNLQSPHDRAEGPSEVSSDRRPLLSVVVPAFNEEALLRQHLAELTAYLDGLADYRWEVVVVNDGSTDDTGAEAEAAARELHDLMVVHHARNRGVGAALRTGFAASTGDYVVTMDADLSYSPDHIEVMLERLREADAAMVVASPYMRGGLTTRVPWIRRVLSQWANRFLSLCSAADLNTLTSMVRAYRGPFVRSLSLRSGDLGILPESVYKTMVLRGHIEQVPAHLDWSKQLERGRERASGTRIAAHILGTTLSGFLLRPFMFFIVPGLLLLTFAAYVNVWMIIHWIEAIERVEATGIEANFSQGVALAYAEYPHTFVIGLLALTLAIQLISLGTISLQNKRYFEELFHLGSVTHSTSKGA